LGGILFKIACHGFPPKSSASSDATAPGPHLSSWYGTGVYKHQNPQPKEKNNAQKATKKHQMKKQTPRKK